MNSEFWHQLWSENDIGFHQAEINLLLIAHIDKLNLQVKQRIFVPLCGKTRDIAWLLKQGYQVAGAELSETAVQQLFIELALVPSCTVLGELTLYQADNIDIFIGDIFNLNQHQLGKVDAIYDRAAMIALPEPMRSRYCKHLVAISNAAPQLLLCYQYDQALMPGPPFSIDALEVQKHYQQTYQLSYVAYFESKEKLKGQCDAKESAWLLKPR